jgi:hypothetical protein
MSMALRCVQSAETFSYFDKSCILLSSDLQWIQVVLEAGRDNPMQPTQTFRRKR